MVVFEPFQLTGKIDGITFGVEEFNKLMVPKRKYAERNAVFEL